MDQHVIVICEECGRKYRVDPGRILGRAAGFSCRSCGHRIRVTKPETAEAPPSAGPQPALPSASPPDPVRPPFRASGLGLRAKAWLVWFLVPAVLLGVAGVLLLDPSAIAFPIAREDAPLILTALGGCLFAALVGGLVYGLRLAGRIERLVSTAEGAIAGSAEPARAPVSGDELDRLAAAVREIQQRLGPRPAPPR